MKTRLLYISIIYLFFSFGLKAQRFVVKEIQRADSNRAGWAQFDIKLFGEDSLIVCQHNALYSLQKFDTSLNLLKYHDHLYVPDSLADSLAGISTYGGCFVDSDGMIRLYGDFTTNTSNWPYYHTTKFTYTFNHNFDSIDSRPKKFFYLINDSIECATIYDSLRFIEVFNRNTNQNNSILFDSIVHPRWQTPGSLFWLRVFSSRNRIILLFQSSRKVVVSALDFEGNLKNQIVVDSYDWHEGYHLDSGMFISQDHFILHYLNESLDTLQTIKVDSNEKVFGVIKSESNPSTMYIFSQEYFGAYMKYYEWKLGSNKPIRKGLVYNPNIQFNLHKSLLMKDSTFLLVGNFKIQGTNEFRSYIAKLSGNPVGESIQLDGEYYQLQDYPLASIYNREVGNFKLFPNPTNSIIRFQYSKNILFNYLLSDLTGKPILQGKIETEGFIDLSSFANGVYILSLYSNNENKTFRILKE